MTVLLPYADVQPHMQLDNFGERGRSYRVIYAPEPSRSHSDWGFVRRIGASDDRWECLCCDRAAFLAATVSCAVFICICMQHPRALAFAAFAGGQVDTYMTTC